MDDKQFIEAYNNVILENMNSVLKQNLIFQTQLKFVEVKDKEISELKEQLAKSQGSDKRVTELQSEVNNLKHQLSNRDDELKKNASSDAERHRLQAAVNTQMKEIEALKNKVSSLEAQQKEKEASAKEQQEYITKLEDMLPKTKKKQLGIETEQVTTQETQNTVKTNGDIFSLSSTGGTF